MNNAEIQIQFPQPGQWDEFTLTPIYQDADGYTRGDQRPQDFYSLGLPGFYHHGPRRRGFFQAFHY